MTSPAITSANTSTHHRSLLRRRRARPRIHVAYNHSLLSLIAFDPMTSARTRRTFHSQQIPSRCSVRESHRAHEPIESSTTFVRQVQRPKQLSKSWCDEYRGEYPTEGRVKSPLHLDTSSNFSPNQALTRCYVSITSPCSPPSLCMLLDSALFKDANDHLLHLQIHRSSCG